MKLTVLCPGIRPSNWQRLYDSVKESFSGEWELIFISPYELPDSLKNKDNVKLINDWGSPIRCQQRGLLEAQGEYITWAADDGYFAKLSLDIGFHKLGDSDYKTLVMGKYIEGVDDGKSVMKDDWYYVLTNHDGCKLKYLTKGFYMLNVGIVSRKLLLEVGGWDCQFEVCPMSYNDLAVRLQNYGVKFIIQNEIMFYCSHLPGHLGDHGPIHDAQTLHDEPLFKLIYDKDEQAVNRIKIDLDNWKEVPERWERRFGKI